MKKIKMSQSGRTISAKKTKSVEISFQRARNPEQKEERRRHLIDTARAILVADFNLELVGLNELARRASMAKSNVYRYFESREALLLFLMWEEWSLWREDLLSELNKWPQSNSAQPSPVHERHMVKVLSRSLARRRLLCELTSVLPTVLERNLSEQTVREFKLKTLIFLTEVGELLEHKIPHVKAEIWMRLLHDAACLMAGLYPHAFPASPVARALDSKDLKFFRRDFVTDLERVMSALLAFSLDTRSRPRKPIGQSPR